MHESKEMMSRSKCNQMKCFLFSKELSCTQCMAFLSMMCILRCILNSIEGISSINFFFKIMNSQKNKFSYSTVSVNIDLDVKLLI